MRRLSVVLLLWGLSLCGQVDAGATPMSVVRVASGLGRPIFVTAPAGDYERLFIVEQTGRIKILNLLTGTVNPTPFLNIDPLTVFGGGADERGLLGMAFDPNYATNGNFYVHYNNNAGNTVVARYSVSATNPDIASTAAQTVLAVSQPFANHNGGWIGFGPDGYLYIGLGDGGAGNDPGNRAQSLANNQKLGKMLRIDVNGASATYDIPADNPFVGAAGDDELWAYGIRNPWRCSFDRETGDLWIGDVGQNAREEVDFQPASSPGGENYGWRCMEGNLCTGLSGCTCNGATLTMPIHQYTQGANGCTVVGGYVYRGMAMPDMQGVYFFGDYCSSRMWSFVRNGNGITSFTERTNEFEPAGSLTISNNSLASFGEDAYGEIYIVDRGTGSNGEIYKIVPANLSSVDCNGNNIVDSVEIELGVAADCNANDIPDACDISGGGSTDVNLNGIPDDCEEPVFVRGDCNVDNLLDLSDAVRLLAFLFIAGDAPDCESSCDVSDDGVLGLPDALELLNYLFTGGTAPTAPFPACGEDPTADSLPCDNFDAANNCP